MRFLSADYRARPGLLAAALPRSRCLADIVSIPLGQTSINRILLTIYNRDCVNVPMELGEERRAMLARRRQRTLTIEVRDALESMILRGDLGGGERINEMRLAEQLGVSRGPVREAARALEREGLVKTVTNEGVYVRELTLGEAVELYDLRAMIAGYLCAELASHATAETHAALRAALAEMDAAIVGGDEETYFRLNLAFHNDIAQLSGASRAAALYGSLGKEVRLMRERVLSGKAALQVSNAEHKDIVDAICAGDTVAARAAGTRHHIKGKERLLDTLTA
jgi:DNA-binding GntR family transcriptional regulator